MNRFVEWMKRWIGINPARLLAENMYESILKEDNMIHHDCVNYDGDEDCNKCCKHGFIFGCEGCDDFEGFGGTNKKNYIDSKGNYINVENLSLRQIYERGIEAGRGDNK